MTTKQVDEIEDALQEVENIQHRIEEALADLEALNLALPKAQAALAAIIAKHEGD